MSKYTDISAKLDDSQPYLTLAKGEHYEVNDDKTNILKMNAAVAEAKSDMEAYGTALNILLGEEAVAKIEQKHPGATTRLNKMRTLFYGTMAAVSGVSVEEAEKRFRKG